MAGESHDAYVVAEVLAAELRPDAELLRHRQDLGLHLEVAERVPRRGRPRGRKAIEIPGARVLRGLQGELGARATDDDRQVVRRTRCRSKATQLLVEELPHRRGVEDGLRLLEQQRLVGRATALGHEQELVRRLVPGGGVGVQLDLSRKVGPGVLLVPHGQRRHLRVAQIEREVGVVHALADRALVVARRQHLLTALAHDDRGARVLAHGQDEAGRDVRVLQQVERDEAVVGRGLGIVEDVRELLKVTRAQQVLDVADRGLGERGDRLGLDLEEGATAGLERRHTFRGQQAVRSLVRTEGQQVLVHEVRHAPSLRRRLCRGGDQASLHADEGPATGRGHRSLAPDCVVLQAKSAMQGVDINRTCVR